MTAPVTQCPILEAQLDQSWTGSASSDQVAGAGRSRRPYWMGRERGFHDHARPPALTSSDSGSGDRPRDNARCGPVVGYPDAYGIRALNSRSAQRPSSTWRAGQHSMVRWAPGVGTAQGLAVVRFGEYHNMQYGGRQRTTRYCDLELVPHTGLPVNHLIRLSRVHRVPPRDA